VDVKLYWMDVSHPSQASRKMLDLKGVRYGRRFGAQRQIALRRWALERTSLPARELFPEYPGRLPPFLPADWLAGP
jgi:hypothetical protein